jgi:hypothetical protein
MACSHQALHTVAINRARRGTLANDQTEPGDARRIAKTHTGKTGAACPFSACHDRFKLDSLGQAMARHCSGKQNACGGKKQEKTESGC